MHEILDNLIYLNLAECKEVIRLLEERIKLLKEREKLAKELGK